MFSDERPAACPVARGADRAFFFHPVAAPAYPQLKHPPYTLALTSKIVEVVAPRAARRRPRPLRAATRRERHLARADPARRKASPRPAIVTTLHGTDITLVGSDPSFLPLTRFSIATSDAVTAPSRWLRRGDARRPSACPRTIAIDVIPNFVDIDRFTPAPPPAPDAPRDVARDRARLELPAGQARRRRGRGVRAACAALAPAARCAWSATDPSARASRRDVARARARAATSSFSASGVDLPDVLRGADSSCCPARPRASAWRRWRRWRAACRSSRRAWAASPR